MDAEEFLESLRKDVLDPAEYADVSGVGDEISELAPVIRRLEKGKPQSAVGELFQSEPGLKLARLLLGLTPAELRTKAEQAVVEPILGQWRSWLQGSSLRGAVVGLLLAKAQATRKDRRRFKFENLVYSALSEAVGRQRTDGLTIGRRVAIGGVRNFDLVVFDAAKPVVAVVEAFQLGSGGRQGDVLRDLPRLQNLLSRQGITLFVVADGPGFSGLVGLVKSVLPEITFLTNLAGVERGDLDGFLREALKPKPAVPAKVVKEREERVTAVVMEALTRGTTITPVLLDITSDAAEAFLLRFRAAHPHYLLEQREHSWASPSADAIKTVRDNFNRARTHTGFSSAGIIAALNDAVGLETKSTVVLDSGIVYELVGLDLPLRLPSPLPVFVPSQPGTLGDMNRVVQLERFLVSTQVPGRVVVLVDPFTPDESRTLSRRLSISRRVQFAVLDENDVVELLLRNRIAARDEFRRFILRGADLSLISPFVAEGPTSPSMFFGRESELKRIVEQVREHSFALIGGRKSGKTSLLQRLNATLPPDFQVVYLDCQAHPDREDFLRFVIEQTPGQADRFHEPFAPQAEAILTSYIDARFGGAFGVLLVDEVDDLFSGDASAAIHPHVLSRALRSLSQSHKTSIVATGERELFALTRDPTSPHWNFCTPIKIGPIDPPASRTLLLSPLRALGVTVSPEALEEALRRTVRHPNLLQHLGGAIVETLAPLSNRGEPLTVDGSTITGLTRSAEFRDRFVRTYWSQSTKLERLVSTELSFQKPRTPDELLGRLRLESTDTKVSDIHEALSYLQLYSIARSSGNGFIFADGAFEEYMGLIPQSLRDEWRAELLHEEL